jgi:hypothetical protein
MECAHSAACSLPWRQIMRTLKTLVAVLLASVIGTVSSCGTMGGGGMRYLVEPPPTASTLG